ncbi:hypothetical protein BH23ACT11_BH23ACT11_28880 [soil metagenome]
MRVRNRELINRIELVEQELDQQRILLRDALGRSDGASPSPAPDGSFTKRPVKLGSPEQAATVSETQPPYDAPQRPYEISTEPVRENDEPGAFGALTDLFRLRGWEWWLNKVGMGLLLFGVVFLFKFSVDQGWLIPEVRVAFGLALGAALIWIGLRVYGDRRAFSQVMLGGGIGTFYITGFAAFQLYGLVPHALAFVFLVAVTLLAFTLSIRQNGAVLAVIGAAGGFGTPFLLYDGSGGLGGLVLYTSLILAGIAAVYLYKGWGSLLLVSSAGVWMVLLAGYLQGAMPTLETGRWSLQAGALFATLVLWLVPLAREVLRIRYPERWPVPERGKLIDSLLDGTSPLHPSLPAHLLTAGLPLVGLAFTQEIWRTSLPHVGWIALAGAAVYALVSGTLWWRLSDARLHYTNSLTGLMLFTLGIVFILEGNALFSALALEAAVLLLVSRRLSDAILSYVAHGLFLIVGAWLAGRIVTGVDQIFAFGADSRRFLSTDALVDISVVALVFGVSASITSGRIARAYRISAHAAVLGLLFRELILLPGGDSLIFLGWAAYASALYLLARNYPEWGTAAGSHILWSVVGLWLVGRLAWGLSFGVTATFSLPALADLAVLCLALLTSWLLSNGKTPTAYRVVVHAAVLTWLWRELSAFPDGAAYVTVAWGIYAAGLLVYGLRRGSTGLARAGVITLFLVVGKLFLVDLAWVGAVWRILLFLGFGGLFLLFSYYLQALWNNRSGSLREPFRSY